MRWLHVRRALLVGAASCLAGFGPAAPAYMPGGGADLAAVDLRCEYVSNPLGVDVPDPHVSWTLRSTKPAQRQTGYRILVASSERRLSQQRGDLWDSGRVVSEDTIQVPYHGKPLGSSQQVFWKVKVWDGESNESEWSAPATWSMGLLHDADWRGRWIGSPGNSETLLLRRELTVAPGLVRAIAHVSGLGQYELSVNGRKAGDDLLAPGWTKYDKTALYDTRDVTPLLHGGRNAIGLLLGNGMYRVNGGRYAKFKGSFGPLRAIVHLRLDYQDGSTEIVGTDERWRTRPGPITFSCVFGGEDYDARAEPQGWSGPQFDDSSWDRAREIDGAGSRLAGLTSAAPPIRAFEVLPPVSHTELNARTTVYDLGQNVALMPRITVRGPSGGVVRIVPAELLGADGSVDRASVGGGQAYWQYTLGGYGSETWFPKFFYHGARYLQVERIAPQGSAELPTLDTLEGVVVHSSSTPIGQFESSSELFNRINSLVRWAQRSNMMSVLTDCPHRERLGWLEEYHLNGPSLRYGFDLARLFAKGMADMADSQLENGLVPDIAPELTVFEGGFRDSPEWGSAYVIVPWQQYEWTGDLDLLRHHYDGMKRYVAYLSTRASDGIVSHGLGDWYDIGPNRPGVAQLTPVPLTATAFYYYDSRILAEAAALLGHVEDAGRYAALADTIRVAFNQRFFDTAHRYYATGSQTANAIPLVMDLVEPQHRAAVLDAVVRDIRQRGNALTAGDVGYRYLLRALADAGRSDVIFDMNHQTAKPGYGYQLKMGATSLTEAWNADPRSSQNHFMLGQIAEWFYRDLAGIAGDPAGPGFKKIVIKPAPVGDLSWVRASFNSVRGTIVSHWTKSGGVFTLSVTLPPGTTATVFMPAAEARTVTERGLAPARRGITYLRREADREVYLVPSGDWQFRAPLATRAQ